MHVISRMLNYELPWRITEMLSKLKLDIRTLSIAPLFLPYPSSLLIPPSKINHQNWREASAYQFRTRSPILLPQLLYLSVRMPGHTEDRPTIAICLTASLPRRNLNECRSILLRIFPRDVYASCMKKFRSDCRTRLSSGRKLK
jgi:hypothetical protein